MGNSITQAILDRIMYIGDKVPQSFTEDDRPKFILLGTPQELIDEVDGNPPIIEVQQGSKPSKGKEK